MPKPAAAEKNVKNREEFSMRYTSINVPMAMNPKAGGSTYLRSESNFIWGRKGKGKEPDPTGEQPQQQQQTIKKGANVIVIHPGSRYLRMGRATDLNPITISNVIARKHKNPADVPPPTTLRRIYQSPSEVENTGPATKPLEGDEYEITVASDDPVDRRIASIATSLRDRMKFYKLKVAKEAAATASKFNSTAQPEIIPEDADPSRIQWVTTPPTNEVVIGERVFRLVEPHKMGYAVRWPVYGNRLNTRQYRSISELMGDVEAIWRTVIREGLKVDQKMFKEYSVILVVPDFWDKTYLREMCHLILVGMGFKNLCVQQESMSASFGTGLSSACVIDIGAVKTSIACVDDGMVIADSRIVLSTAGDDVTEFLYNLLQRIKFPYRELSMTRASDWQILEDLKARLCTLAEGDVAENLYDFTVRLPGQPTKKYPLRAYDEVILAPMCLFEPKVIDFEAKQNVVRPTQQALIEDVVDSPSDYASQTMIISTQHLLPVSSEGQAPPPLGSATPALATNGVSPEQPTFTVAPQPPQDDMGPTSSTSVISAKKSKAEPTESVEPSVADEAEEMEVDPLPEKQQEPIAPRPDLDQQQHQGSRVNFDPACSFPGGFPIDVEFEASKLPLDVAVFNSARASGGDEKIRKYLQAVLVIGGTSLIPGMAHAIESRLQAIATPLVANMEKVQIMPPPKDVDPRVLAWKGACVLAKMESVNDMWVTAQDWEKFELRAIRERCFFF